MKSISLLMPFRERMSLLKQMLASLQATATDPSCLELIMAIDDDDPTLNNYGREKFLEEYWWLNIKIFETKRSEEICNAYWNPMAKMAEGRWLMDINDDSVFKTPGWDSIIIRDMSRRAGKIGDDIIYGKVDDCYTKGGRDSKNCYFSTWALQSKEACDALGFFYDPCIHVGGGDHVMGLIYLALNKITNQDRIVEMYDIVIDHFSFYTDQREKDEFAVRNEGIWERNRFDTTREHEMEYAVKLKEYIDKKKCSI